MTIAFELKREQFVALNGRPAEPGYHFYRSREHTPLRTTSPRAYPHSKMPSLNLNA